MKSFYWVAICCFLWSLQLNAQRRHTIEQGETLSLLAVKYYNDKDEWKKIFDNNKGKKLEVAFNPKTKKPYFVPTLLLDPNLIYPGQVFIIPDIEEPDIIGCDFGGLKLKEKSEGTWNVKKGNLLFEEGSYLKMEKGGKLYLYNEDLYTKKDWTDIGKWDVKDKNIIFSLANEEAVYQIDEQAILKRKFGSYQLDENGNKTENLEMIKGIPPVKTLDVSGKIFFNGSPLEGVVTSGGGKIDTSDASGFYILRLKNGDEISFEKKNYKTKSVYTKDWQIQDIISLEREEPPIPSRVFSGKVLNEQGKAFKGVKVFLELNQQQFGPYQVQKDGTWQSETIPFTWEQIESQATYLILYKKQEKVIEIPENLNEKVDLGSVVFEQ